MTMRKLIEERRREKGFTPAEMPEDVITVEDAVDRGYIPLKEAVNLFWYQFLNHKIDT